MAPITIRKGHLVIHVNDISCLEEAIILLDKQRCEHDDVKQNESSQSWEYIARSIVELAQNIQHEVASAQHTPCIDLRGGDLGVR